MLQDFKSPFDHVTHISCSIVNININKYRANLGDLKKFKTYTSGIEFWSSRRAEYYGENAI
jgi:hypothetical protein